MTRAGKAGKTEKAVKPAVKTMKAVNSRKSGKSEAQGADDRRLMAEAIALSVEGMRKGRGGPFGALVARDGKVVGRGCNEVLAGADPTAHAEITAIRAACRALGTFHLEGCILVTTCEPCPMCLGAAYWARIDRIVYANGRRDAAAIGFSDDFIYREFDRPPGRRSLPMTRAMRKEAMAAFREWRGKSHKTAY